MQPPTEQQLLEFESELTKLVNKHSLEQGCDLPDYAISGMMLATYNAICQVARMVGVHTPPQIDPEGIGHNNYCDGMHTSYPCNVNGMPAKMRERGQ